MNEDFLDTATEQRQIAAAAARDALISSTAKRCARLCSAESIRIVDFEFDTKSEADAFLLGYRTACLNLVAKIKEDLDL